MNIISDVFCLQLTLLRKGFLIRGAITVGDMYHDEHYCFGPALIEAVELEKLAMYPRVILIEKFARRSLFDNPTVNSDLAEGRCINNMIDKDLDGMFYIDYFNVSPDDFDGIIDELFGYLQDLKKSIIDLGDASKNNINLRLKYSWMRKKFEDMMTSIYSNDVPNIQGQAVEGIFKGICSKLRFTE